MAAAERRAMRLLGWPDVRQGGERSLLQGGEVRRILHQPFSTVTHSHPYPGKVRLPAAGRRSREARVHLVTCCRRTSMASMASRSLTLSLTAVRDPTGRNRTTRTQITGWSRWVDGAGERQVDRGRNRRTYGIRHPLSPSCGGV